MKKQIAFDLVEKQFLYGKKDAEQGIFDTTYLNTATNDASLSYLAGWRSADINHNNTKQIVRTKI